MSVKTFKLNNKYFEKKDNGMRRKDRKGDNNMEWRNGAEREWSQGFEKPKKRMYNWKTSVNLVSQNMFSNGIVQRIKLIVTPLSLFEV